MKRFSIVFTVILGLVLIGAGCRMTTTYQISASDTNSADTNKATATSSTTTAGTISYTGQEGKNALELLERNHTVDVTAQGFVNAIDGRKPSERQFWAFYVNDKQADVGAKDYQTHNAETIAWKLEKF